MVDTAPTPVHPLDSLGADEIRSAVAVVRESGRVSDGVLFSTVTLDEPGRDVVAAPGTPDPLRVRRVRQAGRIGAVGMVRQQPG